MLNASSSTKPREISIGIPGDDGGTAIYEDGQPLSFATWPCYPYFHWAGGNAYSSQSLIRLEDNAMRSGMIGYAIDSYTRLGGNRTEGFLSASTSTFGLIRFDGAVSGPLGKGWYYSGGLYVNMDPSSVSTPSKRYVSDMKILKASLTKRWKSGEASLIYKFTDNRDGTYGYNTAPFYYNGDGSISLYEGFKPGRDCYFPEDDNVEYMDVVSGAMVSAKLRDMNTKRIHDATFRITDTLSTGWRLKGNLHFSGSGQLDNTGIYDVGIDETAGGMVQNRLSLNCASSYYDLMLNASASKRLGVHELELGAGAWYDYQYLAASTFKWAHTVEANPARVFRDGASAWNFNESAEYDDGHQWNAIAYARDDWDVSDRLNLFGGIRMEYQRYSVWSAVNPEGATFNSRHDGFYLEDGTVEPQHFSSPGINAVAIGSATYRLGGKLFVNGEYLYARKNKGVAAFGIADMPLLTPTVNQLGRIGIIYEGGWIDFTSMLSYITAENNQGLLHLTKQIGGKSETISRNATYDIGTLGWTTDANIHWKGLSLHLLATLQEPKYRNYSTSLTFSDGTTDKLDYSGNYVTGISRFLLEVDPSYSFGDWRIWMSARFFSRQYASRVNNAWFNGHWETFAGADWQVRRNLGLSLNVVNLFFQNGISGTLDAADTITDNAMLSGLLITGTYIRPFTVNLSVNCRF
jgi:hypothetical protein